MLILRIMSNYQTPPDFSPRILPSVNYKQFKCGFFPDIRGNLFKNKK